MNRELLRLSVDHLCGHKLRLLSLLCMLRKEVGEEEYLQHGEDDEELDGDDDPQRAPQPHLSETVVIEVECVLKESGHRRLRFRSYLRRGNTPPSRGRGAFLRRRSTAAKVGNNSEFPKKSHKNVLVREQLIRRIKDRI